MSALEKLITEYLGEKWASLLTKEPGTQESNIDLARAQGVNDFFLWMENRQRDVNTYIGE